MNSEFRVVGSKARGILANALAEKRSRRIQARTSIHYLNYSDAKYTRIAVCSAAYRKATQSLSKRPGAQEAHVPGASASWAARRDEDRQHANARAMGQSV